MNKHPMFCSHCGTITFSRIKMWYDGALHVICSEECYEKICEELCSRKGIRPERFALEWTKDRVFARDGGRCRLCGKELSFGRDHVEFHHNLPIAVGGDSLPDNVITLCRGCHLKVHSSLKNNQVKLEVGV